MTGFHKKRAECICECMCGMKKGDPMTIPWPLVVWTLFEIAMNSWILFVLLKVGVSK